MQEAKILEKLDEIIRLLKNMLQPMLPTQPLPDSDQRPWWDPNRVWCGQIGVDPNSEVKAQWKNDTSQI